MLYTHMPFCYSSFFNLHDVYTKIVKNEVFFFKRGEIFHPCNFGVETFPGGKFSGWEPLGGNFSVHHYTHNTTIGLMQSLHFPSTVFFTNFDPYNYVLQIHQCPMYLWKSSFEVNQRYP